MFHISLSYIYIITKILIKINFFYKARDEIRTRVIFCLEGRRPKPLDHTCKKEKPAEGLEPPTFTLQGGCATIAPCRHKQFSNMLRFNRRSFNTPTIVWTRALIIVSIATTSLMTEPLGLEPRTLRLIGN